jgi:hypothetical protein
MIPVRPGLIWDTKLVVERLAGRDGALRHESGQMVVRVRARAGNVAKYLRRAVSVRGSMLEQTVPVLKSA